MAETITTPLGNFRKFTYDQEDNPDGRLANCIWQCPQCARWGGLTKKQFLGQISVDCSADSTNGCTYHETHDFDAELKKLGVTIV